MCELCHKRPAVHLEHWSGWQDGLRKWCDQCVPMSGHYEHCPEPCRTLVAKHAKVKRDELREKLAVALWGVHADSYELADMVLDVLKDSGVSIPPK